MKYNNINNNINKNSKGVNKIKEENSIDMGLFEKSSWFNNKVLFIISLVIMSFSSFISVFAVSSYLYNSNEVSFNNSSSSSINSSNVQGAIDELYADAHNYEEMSGRVATLEELIRRNGDYSSLGVSDIELNNNGVYSGNGGFIDFHYSGSTADYTSRIIEEGNGVLNIKAANGVKVNGQKLNTSFVVATNATSSFTCTDLCYVLYSYASGSASQTCLDVINGSSGYLFSALGSKPASITYTKVSNGNFTLKNTQGWGIRFLVLN